MVLTVVTLNDYGRQLDQRVRSPSDGRLMLDTYKRHVDEDEVDDAEAELLQDTSWIDWRHSVPRHRSRPAMFIG